MEPTDEHGSSQNERSSLAQRLVQTGYTELFLRADDETANSFWNEPGATDALRELAGREDAPELARFLAAEILFQKLGDYPRPRERAPLAALYAKALAGSFTRMANSWGLPGLSLGPAGEHFVKLGEEGTAQLARLLDDETGLEYDGSREAMSAEKYGYRVKDMASFLISRIRGLPFEAHVSPQARDAEIEKMKRELK